MPEKTTAAAKTTAEPAARSSARDAASPVVVSTLLGLQHANGNRVLGRLLERAIVQPKLRIGPQGDAYEREADRVADSILSANAEAPFRVLSVGDPGLQRQCHCQDEEVVQRCSCQEKDDDLVQPKAASDAPRAPGFEARVDALRGSGRSLPAGLRAFFEPRFGHDFGGVRVHTGAAASAAADAVRARAFTVGSDVVFGNGEWSPETDSGKRLIAHELTHVVQQTPLVARRKPIVQRETTETMARGSESSGPTETAGASPAESTDSAAPAPEATPTAEPSAMTVIVDDEATQIDQGQMKKGEFLARLRPAIIDAAQSSLTDPGRLEQALPFIDLWIASYEAKSADELNQSLSRLELAERPTTADGYVTAIADKVRDGIATWQATGEVPSDLSQFGDGLPGAGGLLGSLGGLFFKALPGGPRNPESPPAVFRQLGAGQPLDGGIRSRMESAFGRSFAGVHVHTDATAAHLTRRFNARAFTVGRHVAFGAGEYRPGTIAGDALVAHELAHVAQQGGPVDPGHHMAPGTASYGALERDADVSAAGAVASLWGFRIPMPRLPFRAAPRLTTGLRLQGCRSCISGLSAPAISGGISGLTMNVSVSYSDCSGCKDGLEAVQVFWGTRRTDGVQVGTHQTTFSSKTTYDSFVDGGQNSPGGAVYSGNHPYYIGRPDLPKSYGYVGGQGSAGSVSGCTVNPSDTPGAVRLHDEAYFETCIACLNHQGNGKDVLVDAFKWGWTGKGTTFKPSPTSSGSSMEKSDRPSAKFEETLKADYPGYTHD